MRWGCAFLQSGLSSCPEQKCQKQGLADLCLNRDGVPPLARVTFEFAIVLPCLPHCKRHRLPTKTAFRTADDRFCKRA